MYRGASVSKEAKCVLCNKSFNRNSSDIVLSAPWVNKKWYHVQCFSFIHAEKYVKNEREVSK